MNYFTIKNDNFKISRFAVGANQLGMDYGIDTLGKPSQKESQSILKYAVDIGINVFDTSPDYGDSEEVLGNFLNCYNKSSICVITKLECQHYDENIWKNKEEILKRIKGDINLSCKKLGVSKIPIYFVHYAPYAFRDNGIVLDVLTESKYEGKIGYMGVSIYTVGELKQCIEDDRVEAVHIPFSVLDRRLSMTGLIKSAKDRGLAVFARSAYLQGLLIMEPERIPKHLGEVIRFIEKLKKIAIASGHSLKELCLKYVLSVKGIDSIVVGINSMEQIKENIRVFNSGSLSKETIKAIDRLQLPPDYILDPRKWNELKNKFEY